MTQARITETHERTIVRTFGRHELSSLLEAAVLTECAGHEGLKRKVEVRFEDETEGSPAYRVGTKATVTIKVDLASDKPGKPWVLDGDTVCITGAEISGDLVKGGSITP